MSADLRNKYECGDKYGGPMRMNDVYQFGVRYMPNDNSSCYVYKISYMLKCTCSWSGLQY